MAPADLVSDGVLMVSVAAISAVVALAVVGVPLAIAGLFRPVLVVPVVLAGVMVGCGVVWPARPALRTSPAALAVVVGGVGLAAVLGVLSPSQHYVVNRDPGAYTVTALWLAEHGGLVVTGLEGPFAEADGLTAESSAFRDGERDDGAVYAQFAHLTSAVLAVGRWFGGDVVMVRLMPLVGGGAMLALFVLLRLFVRPMAAAVSTLVLASSLPQLWFSRDTYSEPVAQLLLLGGLALLVVGLRQRLLPVVGLAGLSLGAVFSARIDGPLYLVPLALIVAVLTVESAWGRRAGVVLTGGVVVPVIVALVDLGLRSPVYLEDHWHVVRPPLVLAALTLVAAPVLRLGVRRLVGLDPTQGRMAQRAVVLFPWVVTGTLFLLWQVRPLVQTVRVEPAHPWFAFLAQREGEADGARVFSEHALDWVSWYLGPVALTAAIVGAGIAVRRALERGSDLWLPLLVLAPASLLYWWRPGISPDQIWAMRRFLPAALPLVVLCLAVLLDWLWTRRGELASVTRPAAVVVGGLALAVPALISLPLADARELQISAHSMDQLCDALGPDAAALFLEGHGVDNQFPVAARVACGVPTAAGSAAGDYGDLAEGWLREGRRLVLVGAARDTSHGRPATRTIEYPVESLETTITRRPSRLEQNRAALNLYEP